MNDSVAILGVGHLGEAVLTGLLGSGVAATALRGTAFPAERAAQLTDRHGVAVGTDNAAAVAGADVVLVVVPPDRVAGVLTEIGPALSPGTVVACLAAGVPLALLERHLPAGTPVVRVMTNAAIQVDAGMTALSPGSAAGDRLRAVEELFARLGATAVVPESAQDTVTAVAGSGPAFFYRQAAALQDAAVAHGLTPETARLLAVQTLYGAARTLRDSDLTPAELVTQVATPGGTTQAGLDELDRHDLDGAIRAAVDAATARGAELAARLSRS